jgi:alcohol dehydrogenase class IV
MGIQFTKDDITTALLGIEKIEKISKQCGIPDNLNVLGVKDSDIEALADIAMGVTRLLKNNPRELTKVDAIQIYQSLLK